MQRGWRSTPTKAVNKAPSPLAAADLDAATMGPECQVAVARRKTAAMVEPSRNRNQVRGELILPPPCGWAAAESAYRWRQIRRCKWRQRRAPARLLRRQLQHAEMPRVIAQQCSPEFTSIFFCQAGKFVNETFGSEAGVRMSYRPPPLHGNIHFRLLIFNRQVGNLVRKIVGAFDRGGVVALGHHRLEGRPRHEGLPDE